MIESRDDGDWLPAVAVISGLMLIGAMGCTRGADRGAPTPNPGADTLCDRAVLSLSDVSGILRDPIVGSRPVPGDAQSCEFQTDGFPAIVVSLRPGRGRSELGAWITGKMPLVVKPLPGVGESAVWQESLHKAIAQQNNLLCEIQIRGEGADIASAAGTLAARAGALCNKAFAAY